MSTRVLRVKVHNTTIRSLRGSLMRTKCLTHAMSNSCKSAAIGTMSRFRGSRKLPIAKGTSSDARTGLGRSSKGKCHSKNKVMCTRKGQKSVVTRLRSHLTTTNCLANTSSNVCNKSATTTIRRFRGSHQLPISKTMSRRALSLLKKKGAKRTGGRGGGRVGGRRGGGGSVRCAGNSHKDRVGALRGGLHHTKCLSKRTSNVCNGSARDTIHTLRRRCNLSIAKGISSAA